MQAAFVDIGLHKDAFLYAGDYTTNLGDYARAMLAGGDEEGDADVDVEELEARRGGEPPRGDIVRNGPRGPMQGSQEPLGAQGGPRPPLTPLPRRDLGGLH